MGVRCGSSSVLLLSGIIMPWTLKVVIVGLVSHGWYAARCGVQRMTSWLFDAVDFPSLFLGFLTCSFVYWVF